METVYNDNFLDLALKLDKRACFNDFFSELNYDLSSLKKIDTNLKAFISKEETKLKKLQEEEKEKIKRMSALLRSLKAQGFTLDELNQFSDRKSKHSRKTDEIASSEAREQPKKSSESTK